MVFLALGFDANAPGTRRIHSAWKPTKGRAIGENAIKRGNVNATEDAEAGRVVERAREDLAAELCGLGATMTAAMEAQPGFVPCEHAFGIVVEGLEGLASCEDEAELASLAEAVRARSEHVSAHRGVAQGAAKAPSREAPEAVLLLSALLGVAGPAARAMRAGRMDEGLDVFLVSALSALGTGAVTHELLARAGGACARAFELARA